jgi:hypothetical protein
MDFGLYFPLLSTNSPLFFTSSYCTNDSIRSFCLETIASSFKDQTGQFGHKSLRFRFHRHYDTCDQRMNTVYTQAVHSPARCSLSSDISLHLTSPFTETNGNLAERAEEFHRLTVYKKRHLEMHLIYERQIIMTALDIISSYSTKFQFNMIIYSPGELFGTFIIMEELLVELRKQNSQGKICLRLIDAKYQDSIQNFSKPASDQEYPDDCLPAHDFVLNVYDTALIEFIKKMSLILPIGVEIELNIFSDIKDFSAHRHIDNSHISHLLIGPEIDNENSEFKTLCCEMLQNGGNVIYFPPRF